MNKLLLLIILVVNAAILFSCQQKQGQTLSEIDGQGLSADPLPTIKQPKPGAQVSLLSDHKVTLTADKLITIDIVLAAQVGDGSLHVELNPGDGLQLSGVKDSYDFPPSENGQYKITADLYAATNGRYYLNLNTTVKTGSAALFRSLAIIVQVGTTAAVDRSSADMLKRTSGEKVISLSAQEQIINQ